MVARSYQICPQNATKEYNICLTYRLRILGFEQESWIFSRSERSHRATRKATHIKIGHKSPFRKIIFNSDHGEDLTIIIRANFSPLSHYVVKRSRRRDGETRVLFVKSDATEGVAITLLKAMSRQNSFRSVLQV